MWQPCNEIFRLVVDNFFSQQVKFTKKILYRVDLLKKCTLFKKLTYKKFKKLKQNCNKMVQYYCDVGSAIVN